LIVSAVAKSWPRSRTSSGYQYTDSHGQSLVGFAFSYLLGFKLLPRMKNIARQKLVKADADDQVPSCLTGMVADKPIDWEIIAQQYDQMVKYATALPLGTAEAEQVLRRFTRGGPKHPTCSTAAPAPSRQRQRAPGSLHAQPAPAAVRDRLHQHPTGPVRPGPRLAADSTSQPDPLRSCRSR
jgi:hypothetical protein